MIDKKIQADIDRRNGVPEAKKKAMAQAKADFFAGNFGVRHVFRVWGGTDAYAAERDGIYLTKRHDSGGVKGIRQPNRLVVPAAKLKD